MSLRWIRTGQCQFGVPEVCLGLVSSGVLSGDACTMFGAHELVSAFLIRVWVLWTEPGLNLGLFEVRLCLAIYVLVLLGWVWEPPRLISGSV